MEPHAQLNLRIPAKLKYGLQRRILDEREHGQPKITERAVAIKLLNWWLDQPADKARAFLESIPDPEAVTATVPTQSAHH